MSTPARQPETEGPEVDPYAISKRMARQRAKRYARIEHEHEIKRARVRFWWLIGALIFFAVILSLNIWNQIQALFGL